MTPQAKWGILLIVMAFAWGRPVRAQEPLERFARIEPHMGTEFEVVLYARSAEHAEQGFKAAYERIERLNETLSDYLSESELSRLSDSAPHEQWVRVSPDLWYMLAESQKLSQLSGGAFDITVGPLTRLWRRARRRHEPPPPDRLAAAREAVSYQFIELDQDQKRVRLTRPDMRLDLGGIAKGYAVQQAIEAMRSVGIQNALVDGGGDMAVSGAPPGEQGWRIGIAQLEADEPPTRFVMLENRAIATSGDFWQFFEIGDKRYSHILDPRTGRGVTHRSSVTVIAPAGEHADALASALSVLEPEDGMALLKHYPGAVALILRERDGQILEFASPGFADFLVSHGE